ncbi:DUF6588 family protein [Tenacibaculum sp. C7A-26P2]|uniref:DUF6588 family protein n=1 Tax=Tenacibaculum sp. C7A-26P2 TaxID=3447504 RepID=UPI003F835772
MKTFKKISLFLLIIFYSTSYSQELETILLAKDDAQKLTKAYLNPSFKGLIFAMNNGWYHTAKVHKKFGFDISIGANFATIPNEEELFSIAELELSNNTITTNGATSSPTVAGSNSISPAQFQYSTQIEGQNVSANFTMPTGIKEDLPANTIPAPAIQVGFGLPFKLDLIIRYVPKVGSEDVKTDIFGLGIKKEITELLGPLDKTPLHISILAAYSNMGVNYEIGNVNNDVSTQNASANFSLNTYTIQAIASLNFPVLNVFGGIGYNGGSIRLNMLGNYTLNYNTSINGAPDVEESITDPFSIKTSSGSINATIGTRVSLGFFKLYGSYSLQEYNTINAGIAFSFR